MKLPMYLQTKKTTHLSMKMARKAAMTMPKCSEISPCEGKALHTARSETNMPIHNIESVPNLSIHISLTRPQHPQP